MRITSIIYCNRKNRLIVTIGILSTLIIHFVLIRYFGEVLKLPRDKNESHIIESDYVNIYHNKNGFIGEVLDIIKRYIDRISNNSGIDKNIRGKDVRSGASDKAFIKRVFIDALNNPDIIEWNMNETASRYGTYVKTINETCLREDCIYDESSPNIWARKKILVKKVQQHIEEKSNPAKYDSISSGFMETNATINNETHIEFLLTPPIIMIWAYELGFALSEGTFSFDN